MSLSKVTMGTVTMKLTVAAPAGTGLIESASFSAMNAKEAQGPHCKSLNYWQLTESRKWGT